MSTGIGRRLKSKRDAKNKSIEDNDKYRHQERMAEIAQGKDVVQDDDAVGIEKAKTGQAWANMAGTSVSGAETMFGSIFGSKAPKAVAPGQSPEGSASILSNPMVLIAIAVGAYFILGKK